MSVAFGNDNKIFVTDKDKSEIDIFGIVYQTQPNEVKQTNTKTTTTKSVIANGNDDTAKNKKKTGDTTKSKNDPCNYYGLDVCDKDRKGCDSQNFDCLTDSCNDGKSGTTGRCDGDDDKVCWKNGQYLDRCYPAHE